MMNMNMNMGTMGMHHGDLNGPMMTNTNPMNSASFGVHNANSIPPMMNSNTNMMHTVSMNRKKRKSRSWVWEHFSLVPIGNENFVQCRHCDQLGNGLNGRYKYSGGTSNMSLHLTRKHQLSEDNHLNAIISSGTNINANVPAHSGSAKKHTPDTKFANNSKQKSKANPAMHTMSTKQNTAVVHANNSNMLNNVTTFYHMNNVNHINNWCYKVLYYCIHEMVPLNQAYERDLHEILHVPNTIQLPSISHVYDTMQTLYKICLQKVHQLLLDNGASNITNGNGCVISVQYVQINQVFYMVFYLHYVSNTFQRYRFLIHMDRVLLPSSCTVVYMKQKLNDLFQLFPILKQFNIKFIANCIEVRTILQLSIEELRNEYFLHNNATMDSNDITKSFPLKSNVMISLIHLLSNLIQNNLRYVANTITKATLIYQHIQNQELVSLNQSSQLKQPNNSNVTPTKSSSTSNTSVPNSKNFNFGHVIHNTSYTDGSQQSATNIANALNYEHSYMQWLNILSILKFMVAIENNKRARNDSDTDSNQSDTAGGHHTVGLNDLHPTLKIDEVEFETITKLIELLSPFETAVNMMTTSSTFGLVIPVLENLINFLGKYSSMQVDANIDGDVTNPSSCIGSLCENMLAELQRSVYSAKSNYVSLREIGIASAILDPRFKVVSFIDQNEKKKIKEQLHKECSLLKLQYKKNMHNTINPNAATQSVNNNVMASFFADEASLNVSKNEIDIYFDFPPLPFDTKSDPIDWWKINENSFPHLARLARQYLAIPANCNEDDFVDCLSLKNMHTDVVTKSLHHEVSSMKYDVTFQNIILFLHSCQQYENIWPANLTKF